MDIGRFDKTVLFLTNTPATTATGGRTDSYTTLCTTYGYLKKNSSSRGQSFGETAFDNSYTLWVEYQDTIYNAIRTDLKVQIETVLYTISGWEKKEEKRYFLRFDLNRLDG